MLYKCGKKVQIKSQEVLGADSYICWSYIGKTGIGRGGGAFCTPHPK